MNDACPALSPTAFSATSRLARSFTCLAVLVLTTVAISKAPEFLFSHGGEWWTVWLTHEDGPYEAYGALACLAAAIVFFGGYQDAKHAQPSGYRNWFYLLLGAGLCLMFLEEISWGQRLFAIAVPKWLEKANIQQELNLHNLRIFHPSLDDNRLKRLWVFASLGYLGLLPLMAIIPPVGQWIRRLRLPLASWPLAVATLLGFAIYFLAMPRFVRTGDLYAAHDAGEAVETILELAYLVLALETWWKLRQSMPSTALRPSRLVLGFIWLALFGVLTWGLAKPVLHGDSNLDAVAWLRRGNREAAANNMDQALNNYDKSIARWPEQIEPYLRSATILLERREPQAAERRLRKALELAPDRAATYDALGFALSGQRRFDQAAAAFGRAIELNPGSAESYNNLGVVQAEQQHWDQAIASFSRALEINPGSQQSRLNLDAIQGRIRAQKK